MFCVHPFVPLSHLSPIRNDEKRSKKFESNDESVLTVSTQESERANSTENADLFNRGTNTEGRRRDFVINDSPKPGQENSRLRKSFEEQRSVNKVSPL